MASILGFKKDLLLVLRSQFFEHLPLNLYKHALECGEAARSEKKMGEKVKFLRKRRTVIDLFEGCDWPRHIFGDM